LSFGEKKSKEKKINKEQNRQQKGIEKEGGKKER
jgi:hypothetical protein